MTDTAHDIARLLACSTRTEYDTALAMITAEHNAQEDIPPLVRRAHRLHQAAVRNGGTLNVKGQWLALGNRTSSVELGAIRAWLEAQGMGRSVEGRRHGRRVVYQAALPAPGV